MRELEINKCTGLSGPLPTLSAPGALPRLAQLRLARLGLTGTLPPELGAHLPALEQLLLQYLPGVRGPLPASLAKNMPRLKEL